MADEPINLVEGMEKAASLLAERLFQRRQALKKAVGDRPFLGRNLDDNEALAQYMELRHDSQGWQKILQETAIVKEDGRVLLPRQFIDRMREFETRIREGE